MSSRVIQGRLAYPVAVIVSAGLMSAPMNSGSAANSPRFVEFSAMRLQAEATTLIAGLADSAAAKTATALPGATAASSATAAATVEPCYYPCTIFDKFLDSLPPEIRSILLPPLITLAAVIGAVLAPFLLVSSLVFDWPYELGPAAAGKPEDPAGPARAGDLDDGAPTAMQAVPDAPAAVLDEANAHEAEGDAMVRRRGAERPAADAPAETAVPAPDVPQIADAAVAPEPPATEPRPDGEEPIGADLTEMTQSAVPPVAAEAAAADATAVADEQAPGAVANSATEAPDAGPSPRASAKRSAR